jgi:clan AA aspartic protease
MGHVFQDVVLSAEHEEAVRMLVDTGATHSLISPQLADRLGVVRIPQKETVTLANGEKIETDMGAVRVRIGDRAAWSFTLIADCDENLLGVETLETLGLAVDPSEGCLKPTRGYTVRLGGLRG